MGFVNNYSCIEWFFHMEHQHFSQRGLVFFLWEELDTVTMEKTLWKILFHLRHATPLTSLDLFVEKLNNSFYSFIIFFPHSNPVTFQFPPTSQVSPITYQLPTREGEGWHMKASRPHHFLKCCLWKQGNTHFMLFPVQERTDIHDWLVPLWLTEEKVYVIPPTQRAKQILPPVESSGFKLTSVFSGASFHFRQRVFIVPAWNANTVHLQQCISFKPSHINPPALLSKI